MEQDSSHTTVSLNFFCRNFNEASSGFALMINRSARHILSVANSKNAADSLRQQGEFDHVTKWVNLSFLLVKAVNHGCDVIDMI